MRAQVLNNCQGPHLIQGQKNGAMPADLLILRPGLNLVDSKTLAEMRKANKGFDNLFSVKIPATKAVEADPASFGKPMLEVRGTELADKAPLAAVPLADAKTIVELVQDTDVLVGWLGECEPGKQSELIKTINERIKTLTSGIAGV
jgi:hypothetical protein